MLADYYQILNVRPTATDAQIRTAYLKQASVCHPQRGGSNEQMQQVAEAWEVLSQFDRRRRFDRARNEQSRNALEAVEHDVTTAVKDATHYPALWPDFVRINFGFKDVFQLPMPERVIGSAYVLIGGLLGVGVPAFFTVSVGSLAKWDNQSFLAPIIARFIFLPCMAAGAWLGWKFYLRMQSHSNRSHLQRLQEPKTPTNLKHASGAKESLPDKSISDRSMRWAFRVMLLTYIVLMLTNLFGQWSNYLPPELRAWDDNNTQQQEALVRASSLAAVYVLLVFFIYLVHAASVVGLFLLKRWGLWLYVTSMSILLILMSFAGPFLSPGIQMLVQVSSDLAAGAVVALGFCTNVIKAKSA